MRRRLLSLALALGLTLATASAGAQTDPHAGAPNPHAGVPGMDQPTPDSSQPAADLPNGTVEAQIVDDRDKPLPNVEVRLGIHFQSVAEGESKKHVTGRTDAEGKVRFDGLEANSNYSYRISVKSGPAEYASAPFQFRTGMGHRVLLHSFPVTRDLAQAMIGMRGFVYIEPRDDVFQFEVLFRVFNVGRKTWVPSNTYMRLPTGWKAFKANEGMSDARFEADDAHGARLAGTFSPGQHDVSFRFQVPKETSSVASFRIGMPPRVMEIRVIAESSPGMNLDIDGFEPPQTATNQMGERVLVTRRVMRTGDPELKAFSIVLTGLPVPGPGRWIAVAIAAGLALTGFGAAFGWFKTGNDRRRPVIASQDAEQAREILLAELVELEEARQAGKIGPGAYDQARRLLVDSLARISATGAFEKPKKRRAAGARGKVARSTA